MAGMFEEKGIDGITTCIAQLKKEVRRAIVLGDNELARDFCAELKKLYNEELQVDNPGVRRLRLDVEMLLEEMAELRD